MRYRDLYERYRKLAPIPPAEWTRFEAKLRSRLLAPGEYLLRAGEPSREVAFVRRGLLRFFLVDAEGTERTKEFHGPGEVASAFADFLARRPSRTNVTALESSEVLLLDARELESFYRKHPCWERLGRLLLEQAYVAKEQREFDLLQLSAGERYAEFRRRFPRLHDKIPQYHIASYLAITPVALSRIRKRAGLSRRRNPG